MKHFLDYLIVMLTLAFSELGVICASIVYFNLAKWAGITLGIAVLFVAIKILRNIYKEISNYDTAKK